MTEKLQALCEAVDALLGASAQPEDISPEIFALRAAYGDFVNDPILVCYAEGKYEIVSMNLPPGTQMTVIGPTALQREPEAGFEYPVFSKGGVEVDWSILEGAGGAVGP